MANINDIGQNTQIKTNLIRKNNDLCLDEDQMIANRKRAIPQESVPYNKEVYPLIIPEGMGEYEAYLRKKYPSVYQDGQPDSDDQYSSYDGEKGGKGNFPKSRG